VEGDDDGVVEVEGDDVGVCECYFVGNVDGVGGSGGDVDGNGNCVVYINGNIVLTATSTATVSALSTDC
jgi:hypothetical protein